MAIAVGRSKTSDLPKNGFSWSKPSEPGIEGYALGVLEKPQNITVLSPIERDTHALTSFHVLETSPSQLWSKPGVQSVFVLLHSPPPFGKTIVVV